LNELLGVFNIGLIIEATKLSVDKNIKKIICSSTILSVLLIT